MKKLLLLLLMMMLLAAGAWASIVVTPVVSPTSSDNDFTVIQNALSSAISGDVIDLQGNFDWTETNAYNSYLASTANSTSSDMRGVLIPDGLNNLTITSTTSCTIQGPGEIVDLSLIYDGFIMTYDGSTAVGNSNLTISNLHIVDFENAIMMGWNATGIFNGTFIQNNNIELAGDDGNATEWVQNIAIYFWRGTNQTISGNTITFQGDGTRTVGYGGNPASPASYGYQCATSGGSAYNGLQIIGNIFQVGSTSNGVEEISGIWENSHNDDNSCVITISGNSFLGRSGDLFDYAFKLSSQTDQLSITNNFLIDVDNVYIANSSAGNAVGDAYTFSNFTCTNIGGADGIFLENVTNHTPPRIITIYWNTNNTIDGETGIRGLNELSTDATHATRTSSGAEDISYVFGAGNIQTAAVDDSWGTPGRFTDPDGIGSGADPVAYGFNTFTSVQDAINAVTGSTIYVAAGTYTETGQILIDKDLTITGAGMTNTTISPSTNQTNWFQVNSGITFNISGVKLDGTGLVITKAINFLGNGTVNDCWFNEIKGAANYDYGTGVQVESPGDVDITGCTFENMGRTGIRHRGTGVVSSNTYTGKGTGDWLDYFILAEYGCNITIDNNTVTNCTGVASSDGSGSSAFALWDDEYTTATITNNTLTGNSCGIGFAAINSTTIPWPYPVITIGNGNVISGGDEAISFQVYAGYTHDPIVSITGITISGSIAGINIGNGVVVDDITLNQNSITGITDLSVANEGTGTLNATCNWWGSDDPDDIAAVVSGAVDWSPFRIASAGPCDGVAPFENSTTGTSYANLQEALDGAISGETVAVNIPGTYGGIVFNSGETVELTNSSGGTVTFEGASPALTVSSGSLSVSGISYTTSTNDPTILVNGGDLTIRDCNIEASTGFDNAGIRVTSGTLDAGTSGDHGGNTFIYDSPGDKAVDNQTGTTSQAVGNYWGSIVHPEFILRISGPVAFDPWCNSDFSACGYSLLTPGPFTYASKLIREAGTVVVPITVKDFDNVMGISLKLGYESGLTYQDITPGPAPVPSSGWSFFHDGVNQRIVISYQETTGFSLDDDAVLLNVTFTYDGLDQRDLTWIETDPTGTDLEYTNSLTQAPYYDIPNETYYLPGYVTLGSITFEREYPGYPSTQTDEIIEVIVTGGNQFDPPADPYTYSWTGPGEFTSTDNPIIPTGGYGDYTVIATDEDGATITGTYHYDRVHNIVSMLDYPFIKDAIDAVETNTGHVILADPGLYKETATTLTKELDIRGPNYNIDPNVEPSIRGTEAIIMQPDGTPDTYIYLHITADNVSFNGFTFEGNNPDITGTLDASKAIVVNNSNNVELEYNIIQNYWRAGIDADGNVSGINTGVLIANNRILNSLGKGPGYGSAIYFGGNTTGTIDGNHILNSRRCIFFDFNGNGGTVSITNNVLDATLIGIFVNRLSQYGASTVNIDGNSITSSETDIVAFNASIYTGILFATTWHYDGNAISADNNTISGKFNYGIVGWNNADPITVTGGTINGSLMQVGVKHEAVNGAYGNIYTGGGGALTLDGVTISNAPVGVWTNDNGTGVSYDFVITSLVNGTSISGGTTGLKINGSTAGSTAKLDGNTLNNTLFSGQSGNYIELENNAEDIDATAVSFDGITGATATLAQNFGIEDKIVHKIDDGALGFVNVKSNHTFVTENSFTATTLTPDIQRGIDAAGAAGWTVNVEAGTYENLLLVDKSLTLLGPNSGLAGYDVGRGAEATIQFPSGTAYGEVLISVDTDVNDVTISGFDLVCQDATLPNYHYLIVTDKANNLTITNNRMYGSEVAIYVLTDNSLTVYRDGMLIEGNYIDGGPNVNSSYNRGMYIQATAGIIQDNEVINTNIGIQYMPYSHTTSGTIQRNIVSSNLIGLYHNYQTKGAASVTWLQNEVTVAPNDRSGTKALVDGAWTTEMLTFRGMEARTFGTQGTGAAPQVSFNNNKIDGNIGSSPWYTATNGYRTYDTDATGLATLSENSFVNVDMGAVNNSAVQVTATCNWWGSNVFDDISPLVSGDVDYIPWLSDGTDNEPATIGFQPVPGSCDGNPLISGTLKYNNATKEPMNGVTLTLSGGSLTTPVDAVTDAGGNFTFDDIDIEPSTFTISVTDLKAPGSINATDAALANYWGTTYPYAIEYVRFLAGDVNFDYSLNATDAQKIQLYFVNPAGNGFDRSPWSYWKTNDYVVGDATKNPIQVTVSDANVTQDLYGQVTGDFNMSYKWVLFKGMAANVQITHGNTLEVGAGMETTLPINVVNAADLRAVSLVLIFPTDLMEVTDVTMKENNGRFDWAIIGNELRIGWNSATPLSFAAGEELVTLHLKTSESFVQGQAIRLDVTADPVNELADATLATIPDAVLSIDVLEANTLGLGDLDLNSTLTLQASPNPFGNYTQLSYSLPADGHVTLEISNMYGRVIATLADDLMTAGNYTVKLDAMSLSPGVYMATIRLNTSDKDLMQTIKIVLNR